MPVLITAENQNEYYKKLVDAARLLKIDEVEELLKQGVKPNNSEWEKEHGYSVFSVCVKHFPEASVIKIFNLLKEYGGDIQLSADQPPIRLLDDALLAKRFQTTKYLLTDWQIDINSIICEGSQSTLLHFTARRKDIVSAKFLIENGANINMKNCDKKTFIELFENMDSRLAIINFIQPFGITSSETALQSYSFLRQRNTPKTQALVPKHAAFSTKKNI